VPFGRGADTQFLVFDSSWVGVTPIPPADLMFRNYRAQFEAIFALGARTPHAFFMSHHPVLGFAANPGNPQNPYPGNGGLQSVLAPMYPAVLFPPNIEALLSGHNHLFEVVTFATAQVPQIITGNGGDWLDEPFPVPFPKAAQPAPGAIVAELVSTTRFGYLIAQREAAGWSMRAFDVDGKLLTTCALAQRKAACTPIASGSNKPSRSPALASKIRAGLPVTTIRCPIPYLCRTRRRRLLPLWYRRPWPHSLRLPLRPRGG